jgi:hypothetical protein
MKIGMVSFYDNNIKDYADVFTKTHLLYCNKFGIDYKYYNVPLLENVPAAWNKIIYILKDLHNYDYLIWIDADAFFTETAKDIKNLINIYDNSHKHIYASFDINGFNAGVMIFKNSLYSYSILGNVLSSIKENRNHGWWDNVRFMSLFNDKADNSLFIMDKTWNHYLDFTKESIDITKDINIVHLAGVPSVVRNAVAKKIQERLVKY